MAGSSMKDIKLRIKSVESTMQITKAMQLVATSKLRRAKERMESSKPYTQVAGEAMKAAIASCSRDGTVPYSTRRPLKKRCFVVIAGDRGLAGGYNNNIFKAVRGYGDDVPCCSLPVGVKAIEFCTRAGLSPLSADFNRVEGMTVKNCYSMAQQLLKGYDAGDFDELVLVYTDFRNMISQDVVTEVLLPLPLPEDAETRAVSVEYEPSADELLKDVIDDFLAGKLYSAICDSFASEVAARRNAMNSATDNAEAMIDDLRLRYNRARQGSITQEITEIVAGAEQ